MLLLSRLLPLVELHIKDHILSGNIRRQKLQNRSIATSHGPCTHECETFYLFGIESLIKYETINNMFGFRFAHPKLRFEGTN